MTELLDCTVVTGVVGEDVHTIGIDMIEKHLRDEGFDVVSLGVKQPYEEFLDAIEREKAACAVMSSLNGHAIQSCGGMGEEIKSRNLDDRYYYIGGNLTLDPDVNVEEVLLQPEYGFDRVYHQVEDISVLVEDIKRDL